MAHSSKRVSLGREAAAAAWQLPLLGLPFPLLFWIVVLFRIWILPLDADSTFFFCGLGLACCLWGLVMACVALCSARRHGAAGILKPVIVGLLINALASSLSVWTIVRLLSAP